jgi:pimeloyl-ACP methyl ester carboxylesterase
VRERPLRSYPDVEAAARRLCEHDPLLAMPLARTLAASGTRPAEGGGVTFKHDPLHATRGPYGFDLAVAERFWANITCNVLLLEGGESMMRHAEDEAVRRESILKRARKIVIPAAGHMMQRHQPAKMATALLDFLG